MEESISTKLWINARKSIPTILETGQTRWRKTSLMLRIGRWKNGHPLWQKWRTEEKVSILLESELSSSIPVPSSNPSTINPALQDNVLLPEGFSDKIYRVGNGKALRSLVNHGFIQEESVSEQTNMLCSSLMWIRWIIKMTKGKPCATCHKQESRHTKILGNAFRIQHWQLEARSTKKTVILSNKIKRSIFYDTVCAEFIEKAIWMKTKDQFLQGKAWF